MSREAGVQTFKVQHYSPVMECIIVAPLQRQSYKTPIISMNISLSQPAESLNGSIIALQKSPFRFLHCKFVRLRERMDGKLHVPSDLPSPLSFHSHLPGSAAVMCASMHMRTVGLMQPVSNVIPH